MTDSEKASIQKECRKFIEKDPCLARKFNLCSEEDKEWVLNYLSTGKGTIPYEMNTGYDWLDVSPEKGDFFKTHEFYSHLKDGVLTEAEYNNVKSFYQTTRLKNLGELNKMNNFQDTIILCKIFEQRSEQLQKLFRYNPRQCDSASSFSGCAQRDKSKCLIALPSEVEHVRVFKTLIGSFSYVNTRLALDTQILFDLKIDGKNKQKEYLQLY